MKSRAALLAGCVGILACTEIDTGPNVPVSMEFDALPFPAVVAGDTLRDTSGIAAPLRAVVFNSDNDEIVGATVLYSTLDPVVTVDNSTGMLVAGAVADTTARVIASVGDLQSAPLRLSVVRRPEALTAVGTIDTLRYSVTDTTRNVSDNLEVRLTHGTTTGNVPVRDWIVTFALETPADSMRARLLNDNQRRSASDTTSPAGVAARRVRLIPAGLTTASDSVVVRARARYRGMDVAGSPVRLVLHVRPNVP